MTTETQRIAEIARRRTFAIISHPDAGKTTLTEKLLLYGGAINMAGSVAARKNRRAATSDWMELEKQRGISITSTVLQFPYAGYVLNLLDTPGHEDFSEDTYRTLVAADSAVMLIDAAKGVEPQTRKLFAVCRQRGIPIFTFINKMDRPSRDPLDLMDEIGELLGIECVPVNYPVGEGGDRFKGVYDRTTGEIFLFERTQHGSHRAPVQSTDLADRATLEPLMGAEGYEKLVGDIELLDVAGAPLDDGKIARGEISPVFFGSAVTNFGVEPFLNRFITMAPPPAPRLADKGDVFPEEPEFRGFVFKVQANMDPNHRDRIAFMRVVSGKFERDMTATVARTGKTIRLSRPQKLFAQDREIVEEAYPGDIVGLTNPGAFALGDTVCVGKVLRFAALPKFAPEHFAGLRNKKIEAYKNFQKGVQQLSEEGIVQTFYDAQASRMEPILGVVGQLQLEVVQYRMRAEYNVETVIEPTPFSLVRWLDGSPDALKNIFWTPGTKRVVDEAENLCVLFESDWGMNYLVEKNPAVEFLDSPDKKKF